VVISHWVLDALTHRPDLPLYPGSPTYVGLGLWNSRAGTVLVEGASFALGSMLYIHATRPCDRVGIIALWSFIAVLVLIYLVNLFGPPPPSVRAIATAGLSLWLFVVWAYWLDRHRQARSLPGTPPGA
jgi:hypothetical protein